MAKPKTETEAPAPEAKPKAKPKRPPKIKATEVLVVGSKTPEQGFVTEHETGIASVLDKNGEEPRTRTVHCSKSSGSCVEYADVLVGDETKQAWVLRPFYREQGWDLVSFTHG